MKINEIDLVRAINDALKAENARLRNALALYLSTYADTMKRPTATQEMDCIAAARAALAKEKK